LFDRPKPTVGCSANGRRRRRRRARRGRRRRRVRRGRRRRKRRRRGGAGGRRIRRRGRRRGGGGRRRRRRRSLALRPLQFMSIYKMLRKNFDFLGFYLLSVGDVPASRPHPAYY